MVTGLYFVQDKIVFWMVSSDRMKVSVFITSLGISPPYVLNQRIQASLNCFKPLLACEVRRDSSYPEETDSTWWMDVMINLMGP